jgi:hypothetical protein
MTTRPATFSIRKASKRLGLSRPTVVSLIKRGVFHVTEGDLGAKLIPGDEIDQYIAEHGVKVKPAEPEGLFGLTGDDQPEALEAAPASADLLGVLQEIREHVVEIKYEIAALRRQRLAGLVASANGADVNLLAERGEPEPQRTPLGSRW